MTKTEAEALLGDLKPLLAAIVDKHMAMEKRMAVIEQRSIADLFTEAYKGVWRPGDDHPKGALITDRGSLWIALAQTNSRPGESPHWQLCVKSGRDVR